MARLSDYQQRKEALQQYFAKYSTRGKIPDTGYCIRSARGSSIYNACFLDLARARRAAQALANMAPGGVHLVQVRDRGNDRFIVDEFHAKRGR
jgi:hypothetical protein